MDKESVKRVKEYIARRKKSRGMDVEHVHSFDVGPDCGVELLLSDIEAILLVAVPQVVADERKLPPLPQYFPDIVNIRADEELRAQDYATQYARAALQAAPVQPVAVPDAGIVNDANRYQHIKRFCFHRTMNGYDKRVTAWNLHIAACEDDPNNLDAALDIERQFQGEKPFYAAPAAQGDTISLTRDELVNHRNQAFEQGVCEGKDQAAQGDAKGAARWREALQYVGADRSPALGCNYFVLRGIHAIPGIDLMRGGVAGHFTDAIDAAIAAKAAS